MKEKTTLSQTPFISVQEKSIYMTFIHDRFLQIKYVPHRTEICASVLVTAC